jgi:hypothetical protein
LESSNGINDAICLIEKKEEEREGRRRELQGG